MWRKIEIICLIKMNWKNTQSCLNNLTKKKEYGIPRLLKNKQKLADEPPSLKIKRKINVI